METTQFHRAKQHLFDSADPQNSPKTLAQRNLNKYLGFPMILLLCGSLLVLLAGHRLVNIVVLTSVILATFFLTFEFLRWSGIKFLCDCLQIKKWIRLSEAV